MSDWFACILIIKLNGIIRRRLVTLLNMIIHKVVRMVVLEWLCKFLKQNENTTGTCSLSTYFVALFPDHTDEPVNKNANKSEVG